MSFIVMQHFARVDQRLLQGNIFYVALFQGQYLDISLEPGRYLDIARKGGYWPAFDQTFDLHF